jgi:MFS family permease
MIPRLNLRRDHDLLSFLASRFLATIGMQMQFVAIGWQVYELTHRPLDLGLVGLVQFLPVAGFSILGGQVADRMDRRKIIRISQVVMVLCLGALGLLAAKQLLTTPIIYLILLVAGVTRAFWGPATQSFLPRLVSADRLPRAVAWNSSTWQIAVIVGPSAGGLLYAWSGRPSTVYFAAALCMLLAFALTSMIRTRTGRADQERFSRKTLLAGIHYVWNQKVLLGSMSLDLFAVLLGGAVALLPAYASDILKVGPAGLGILRAGPSIGAAVTGLFLSFRPIQSRVGTRLFICVTGFGVFTILFGLSTNFALSVLCLVLLGALDLFSVVTRQSLMQLRTPDQMRGRVAAVNFIFVGASNELGEFESGITAAWFGLVPSVVIGGIGTCVVAAFWAWRFPELRKLDRFVEPNPN